MFVYWGKKAVRRFLGFCADFCSIDRSFQPFSVFSVAVASHLYGVSLNSGQVIGYEIVCRRCSTTYPLRSLPYSQLSDHELSVNELISLTYPNFRDDYGDRLHFEEVVKQNPESIPQSAREILIREPFEQLDHDAGKIGNDLYIDKTRGIGCAGILGAVIISWCLAVYVEEPVRTPASLTAAGLIFIGIIYTLFLSATGPKKAFREKILPRLVTALIPLVPEKEELQICMHKLNTMGGRINRFIKPDELYKQIRSGVNSDHFLTEASSETPAETSAPAMQFSFYDSSGRVQTRVFNDPQITIGSSQRCDLIFPGSALEQCRVYLSVQGYYAHDLGGGLIINEKGGSGFLKDNDVLYIGSTAIRFNITGQHPNFLLAETIEPGWNEVRSIAEE